MDVIEMEVMDWDEYTGRLEAVEMVDVRARVSGYLEHVNFKDGDKVKKGDLLFQIDSRTYAAELKRAESELARTRSRVELSQNDFKRAERLRLSKAISDEEYDLRSKTVTENTATMHAAEAAVQMARLNYEFTQVRSPIDGRIGRELITSGNIINGDQTLLTTIVSIDPIYVYLDTDERAVLKYRRLAAVGQRANENEGRIIVQLGLIDENGYPHQGYIDYVDPRMDASTGTLKVRGLIKNPDQLLSPGLFARVRIHGGSPHPALLIPGRAIGTDQDQQFVWVVKPDGLVDYRKIKPGIQFGSFRTVLEGLSVDDQIVVDGLPKVRPGVKVQAEKISVPYDG
jgi:multidrug efflux system membrane fusion protein